MRRLLLVFLAPLALAACAPPRTAAPPSLLPLRSLRLYETGVGYFEQSGEPTSSATLPVPAGHLDDALKSLVVISAAGQSKVGGLAFPSSVSKGMARALSGLPVDGDAPLSYRDLLVSLKGAEVELARHGCSLRGRIIEVIGREPSVKQEPAADSGKNAGEGSSSPVRAQDPQRAPAQNDEFALLVLTERGKWNESGSPRLSVCARSIPTLLPGWGPRSTPCRAGAPRSTAPSGSLASCAVPSRSAT